MKSTSSLLFLFFLSQFVFCQTESSHFRFHKKSNQKKTIPSDLEPGSPAAMAIEIETLGVLRFSKKYWHQVLFFEDSAELSIEGEGILHLIGKAFRADTWYHKMIIRVASGNSEMMEERLLTVEDLLYKAGLNKRDFKIKQVMVSDMQKDWDGKNDFLWIRFD